MSQVFNSTSAEVLLPKVIADGMIKKTLSTSTVARLVGATPQRFGKTEQIVFNDLPRMEFVEEGGEHGSTNAGFTSAKIRRHKGHVTMRFSEEIEHADEEDQLHILETVAEAGAAALERGLDFGIYHRINPLSGQPISSWEDYVCATTKRVEIGAGSAEIDDDIATAVGLLVNDATWACQPTGMALDPKTVWALSQLKRKDGSGNTSDRRYPGLGLGLDVTTFESIPAAVGTTVSGLPEATDTKVRAIVGDFQQGIRWGVARELPVELIRHGDPDGKGDLKRKGEIALRLKIYYAWVVLKDRFVVIEDKS